VVSFACRVPDDLFQWSNPVGPLQSESMVRVDGRKCLMIARLPPVFWRCRPDRRRKVVRHGQTRASVENCAFEVQLETTLWGTIKELREVPALAESGRPSPIPLEFEPLDRINDVYARMKKRQIAGRAVIQPW